MNDPEDQIDTTAPPPSGTSVPGHRDATPGYSGRDNLQVMRHAHNYNNFLLNLVRASATSKDRILDFGAGLGFFASELGKQNLNVICVEADAFLASEIDSIGIRCFRNLSDIANESIDLIYTLNVLEHIDDDASAVSMLLSKLKPGGRLIVYVPAFPILFSEMDRAVGHCRRYTMQSLNRLLLSCSLSVEKMEYVDSIGFPATLAYKLVNSNGEINPASLKLYDRMMFPISRLIDRVTNKWFGKNLLAVATKPLSTGERTDTSGKTGSQLEGSSIFPETGSIKLTSPV